MVARRRPMRTAGPPGGCCTGTGGDVGVHKCALCDQNGRSPTRGWWHGAALCVRRGHRAGAARIRRANRGSDKCDCDLNGRSPGRGWWHVAALCVRQDPRKSAARVQRTDMSHAYVCAVGTHSGESSWEPVDVVGQCMHSMAGTVWHQHGQDGEGMMWRTCNDTKLPSTGLAQL